MKLFFSFLLIFIGRTSGEMNDNGNENENESALYYEASNYGMTWIEAAQVYFSFLSSNLILYILFNFW